jgi:methyl-accepting chemotaxis protein
MGYTVDMESMPPISSVPGPVDGKARRVEPRVGFVVLAMALSQLAMIVVVARLARDAHSLPWIGAGVVGAIGVAIAVGAVVFLRNGDRVRLRRLSRAVAAMNGGDLSVSIGSTRQDDLGDVERGVDAAIGRLQQIVAVMQQGVDRFRAGRLSVADVHKEMLDAAEMTAGQAYDVGVTAEQVSDSIHIVASSTEELAATVNEIARHATLAADIAVSAAAQGEVADAGVRELSAAMQQVEDIANVISTIAGQTHLLALNAAIEAARAGDAGRGFGIVAAEVKELSRATAEATEQVRAIVAGIRKGSSRASEAINQISSTMSLICENTASIAAAVTQQTATTREIGRVSVTAAQGASDITGRVSAVHTRAREVAYVGAQNDAAKAEEFAILEAAFRGAVDGYQVGGFVAVIDSADDVQVDQARLNAVGTTTVGGVTSVVDNVLGSGLNEFEYSGAWLFGNGYETDPGGDAYSSVPGDEVRLRFVGTKLRFTGCKDKQQGMADVWIDGQAPTLIDFYSPARAHTMMWESPELSTGEHTFHLRVSQKKNPESRYFWVSVAKVEIVR